MSDTYQAVYDAVRSRLGNCDIGGVVKDAFCQAAYEHEIAGREAQRPFMLLRPRIFIDGNMWCALYGDNLQDGVAGFGETPEKAAKDFDAHWTTERAK